MSMQENQPSKTPVLFDVREQGTVLAALRHYQEFLRNGEPTVPGLLDISSLGGSVTPLTTREIEELCEKSNFGSPLTELKAFITAQAK